MSRALRTLAASLATAVALLLTAAPAQDASAALISFSGTFAGNDSILAFTPSSISAIWTSAVFDTSVVPAVGDAQFAIPMLSLSFTPSPYTGATTFSAANTGILVYYRDGANTQLSVGGLVSGVANDLAGTDDFRADYNSGSRPAVYWTVASVTDAYNSGDFYIGGGLTGSYSITSAPEPSAGGMMIVGLLALLAARLAQRL